MQAPSNKETINKKTRSGLFIGQLQNDGGENAMSIGAKGETDKARRNVRLVGAPTTRFAIGHFL